MEMIPDEAIRLRILANSDSDHDQKIKLAVRDQVSFYITELVKNIDNIDEARAMIENHILEVEKNVHQTLLYEGDLHYFYLEYRIIYILNESIYTYYIVTDVIYVYSIHNN